VARFPEHGVDGGKVVVELADDYERHTDYVAQSPHPRQIRKTHNGSVRVG
jgi:hypothetical protein